MQRYFFDLYNASHVHHDFSGRYFNRPTDAREMAELIALDAAFDSDASAGIEVQVRDSAGRHWFTVPVLAADQVAA